MRMQESDEKKKKNIPRSGMNPACVPERLW